ncbi:uncharacterized protein LOC110105396 [Dendrobium catenatum]|uniref:uncharacterized protein LOC110105396 n=1 Tax=Dendrobium catenatum TaxID=906689 RepID=UPI0010A05314|nr:uncharacterized protein LOC110105396 [Dendrobium catenatum]
MKEIVKLPNAIFLGLLETKISNFDIREVKKLMGEELEFDLVPSNGLSGGIIVLWNSNFAEFSKVASSSQCLIGDLTINRNYKMRVAAVYGSKEIIKRRELWVLLEFYNVKEYPLVVGGDFNCITSKEDKRGGKKFCFSLGAREMGSFISNNDLHEIGFIGPRFTWCNNKSGGARILERLDRCFLNSSSLNYFSQLTVRHLARIASDHSPLVLNLCNFNSTNKRRIIFEDIWGSFPASFAVVKKEWNKKFSGDYSQIRNVKCKRMLKALFWSKAKLRNLEDLKSNLMEDILKLQITEAEVGWLSEDDCWKMKSKVAELNSTMAQLCSWWKQRAKVKWMKEGDCNSKFYHSYASARRIGNKILKIKNENGIVLEEQSQIVDVFMQFFSIKWKQRSCNLDDWPNPGKILNMEEKDNLSKEFTVEEIEFVIKNLGNNIAPVATRKAVLEVKAILSKFSMWTGQKINTKKSAIIFGSNVNRRKKKQISRIIGFKQVKELVYLGIKMSLRRMVASDFYFIIEKELEVLLEIAMEGSYWPLGILVSIGTFTNWNFRLSKL